MKKQIIGIDQSLTNTAIVCLESEGNTYQIKFIKELQAEKPMKFNESLLKNNYTLSTKRIDDFINEINKTLRENLDPEIPTVFLAETPSITSTNATHTVYMLAYLYFQLNKMIYKYYLSNLWTIYPLSHKSLVFQEYNKQMKKSLLFEYHWEDAYKKAIMYCQNAEEFYLYSEDLKDAFSVAYTGFLLSNLTFGDYKTYPFFLDKKYHKSLDKIMCANIRDNKNCWYCPLYEKGCLEPKDKTKALKRQKTIVECCQMMQFTNIVECEKIE